MSPSEWKWAVEAGLVVDPWRQHMGGKEWDWQALTAATEADRLGVKLLEAEEIAMFGVAQHFAKHGDQDADAVWLNTLRRTRNLRSGRIVHDAGPNFGMMSFKEYGFAAGVDGLGLMVRAFEDCGGWNAHAFRVFRLPDCGAPARDTTPMLSVENAPSREQVIAEAIHSYIGSAGTDPTDPREAIH